ncbi:methyl-accepting chemotaxis protein [Desulfocurvus vexinensis]|uniref:methyl-accepting chemotaxis protein n=1 Tax=Desulfocurvus vexinensis TaxID=399548 RepID=UPI0004B3434B|nr:methyl-accepting chemotaxis protein [Desulfocurvus vexinensis]
MFISRLNISTKLAVSSFAFVLPIAVLLYFMIAGVNASIRFSAMEYYGDAYQRPLAGLLEAVPAHGRLLTRQALGQGGLDGELAAIRRRADQAFADLEAADKAYGEDLQVTDAGLAMRQRSHLTVARLKSQWAALRALTRPAPDDHAALLQDVRGLIAHVGDTSNLILDPDLDSYYIMDITLLALPQTQARLAEILDFGLTALPAGPLDEAQRRRVMVMASMLRESDMARVLASAAVSLSEDQNFYGTSPSLQAALPPRLAAYEQATTDFLALLDALAAQDAQRTDEATFLAKGEAALAASFALWSTAVDELDTLLQVRIDHYKTTRLVSLVCTAAALLAAGLLVLLIGRSVTRPLRQVQAYAQAVAGGDLKAEVQGTFGGELGALAAHVQAMVSQLKVRLGFAQGILGALGSPCLVTDNGGLATFINPQMTRLLGCAALPGGGLGRPVDELFPRDQHHRDMIRQAVSTRHQFADVETEAVMRDGSRTHVLSCVAPLYDLDGNLLGAFTLMQDISNLKAQEQAIALSHQTLLETATQAETIARTVLDTLGDLAAHVQAADQGSELQRERTSQAASAMDQVNASILDVARNAQQAASRADQSRDKAQQGSEVVGQAATAIAEVAVLARDLKQNMGALGHQAESIGAIMNVINDIADQTNLLALNAAIEAARAGEAGRGFAVVADEVRKLAEKTMHATREVGTAIAGIQTSTQRNMEGMDRAVAAVERVTTLADHSGNALAEIVHLADSSSDMVRGIAAASEQQSAASEQIGRSVEEISTISARTADGMARSRQALDRLSLQARDLQELITHMRG